METNINNDKTIVSSSSFLEKINISFLANLFISLSIVLYSYRGNVGAIFALVAIFLKLFDKSSCFEYKNTIKNIWLLFLIIFPIFNYIILNKNLEFYVLTAYILCVFLMLFLKKKDFFEILKFLYIFSFISLMGILLQKYLSFVYQPFINLVYSDDIVSQINSRFSEGYVTGFSREVSYTALYLIIGVIYSFFMLKGKKKYVLSVIFILALFLIGKKAQPIFLILSLLFIKAISGKDVLKKLSGLLIVVGLIILGYFLFPFWKNISILSRFSEFIDAFMSGKSVIGLTSGRSVLYERALELWKQNKVFGIGWENFRNMASISGSDWFAYFDVHNCYLQILCECGIVGIIFFGILVLMSLLIVIKKNYKANVTFVQLCSTFIVFFLLYCITGTCLYTDSYAIVFFIMLLILITYKKEYINETK